MCIDTGARVSEISHLWWHPTDETRSDVDLERGIHRALGKGRRELVLAVGRNLYDLPGMAEQVYQAAKIQTKAVFACRIMAETC